MKKIIPLLILFILPSLTLASINVSLKYGMRGDDVKSLQAFLVSKHFLSTPATGYFGTLTVKAVKAYQASVGVPATGLVGSMTRAKINGELSGPASGYIWAVNKTSTNGSNASISSSAAVCPPGYTCTPPSTASATSVATSNNNLKSAQVQSYIANMRATAELFYATAGNNTYGAAGTTCYGANATALFNASNANNLSPLVTYVMNIVGSNIACNVSSGGTAWAFTAQNPTNSAGSICADSTGTFTTSTTTAYNAEIRNGACLR